VAKRLIFTGPRGGHVWRTSLNEEAWKPALAAAGVIPVPKRGQPYAESRENGMHALRHCYASVLLDAGENIKPLGPWPDAPRVRASDALQPGTYAKGNRSSIRRMRPVDLSPRLAGSRREPPTLSFSLGRNLSG
jgi:hypothetical protein